MSEKKSYFVPLKKPCPYWDKCSDFLKKCSECELNKELQLVQEPKPVQQEKRSFEDLKETLGERYKQMPENFKLF